MKRVAIFSTNYLPNIGGAEIAVKEITDRITDLEFHLICARLSRSLPASEKIGNVTVHRIGIGHGVDKILLFIAGALRAFSLHRKNPIDALWVIMAGHGSVAASLFKLLKPSVPLVLTLQEGDEEDHLKRYVKGNDFLYKILIRPLHRWVFRVADRATVISNYLGDRVKRNNPRLPIALVPNGVDIPRFSKRLSTDARNQIRSALGFSENDIVLVTTSRLVVKNAVEYVIRALPLLSENVKFLVIGKGELEILLKELAKSLNVEQRTVWLGSMPHEDIPKYLHASDIFIRPSLSEGMGNSFIEAMAARIPVVATSVGGIPDFLFDRETGIFVEPKNPESIRDQVNLLIGDVLLREKLVANAEKLVHEKYSWDLIAQEMKESLTK